jgi:hypothetical protein
MTETVLLKEFLRTGQLGRVCLGMSEHEVTAMIGRSDASGGTFRKYPKPSLFEYGDIELFYDYNSRLLNLIVINFWEPRFPSGGSTIDLHPWIIKGGLQAEELICQLEREGIPYSEVEPINYETRQLLVNSAVTMIFNNNIEEWQGWEGLCKLYAGH